MGNTNEQERARLKTFEQARQDMRRIGILGYINEGARLMLLRLIELKLVSDAPVPLLANEKSMKKEQAHIDAVFIKQMLTDIRFMDGVLLGEDTVLTWDKYVEKNKEYKMYKAHLKSDMRTVTFFEEVKDEEL